MKRRIFIAISVVLVAVFFIALPVKKAQQNKEMPVIQRVYQRQVQKQELKTSIGTMDFNYREIKKEVSDWILIFGQILGILSGFVALITRRKK